MTQTTAVAPRLPSLLEAMKEEIARALTLENNPVVIEKKAQRTLFSKLLIDLKEASERVHGVAGYYDEENYPKRYEESIASLRVAMQRMDGFLHFRETLKKFELAQEEAARTLPSDPDYNVDEEDVV